MPDEGAARFEQDLLRPTGEAVEQRRRDTPRGTAGARRGSGCRSRRRGRCGAAQYPPRSSASTSSSALSSAATNGATSVSCEPTWQSMPTTWRCARGARPCGTAGARPRSATPNLFSLRPVEMYGCVFGSTSGFTRTDTGARLPRLGGDAFDALELAARLDVEAEDAGGERLTDLGFRLADAGEHHLARIAAGGDHARELAAGDDVEARAEAREHVEHREVGVRLHRVAHEVIAAGERRGERAERALERGARVDEAGRAEPARDVFQRDRLGVQPAVPDGERRHVISSWQ